MQQAHESITVVSAQWKKALSLLAVLTLLLGGVFYTTVASMVSIWWRSETFTHAFLIVPISLWLIWEKRAWWLATVPRFSWLGLFFLAAAGVLWLLGFLVDALVIQQFAWVFMLIALVWSVVGTHSAWVIAFPLAFLLFLVPVGEDLVPPMMEFTADFTVAMVKLTGIPVYREGLYFMLPTGNWSVVEACSGIRYLIASVTLGCLYAYLTYNSLTKRLIFILVSILVPILANGLRAYIIVMLGHLSDMTIATGVDHLVYGWFFFGIVIFILISIGAWFRDPLETPPKPSANDHNSAPYAWLPALPVLLVAVVVWPGVAYSIEQRANALTSTVINPLALADYPSEVQEAWDWRPVGVGAQEIRQFFRLDGADAGLVVHYYPKQSAGAEMINWQNVLISAEQEHWRLLESTTYTLAQLAMTVDQITLTDGQQRLLAWSWYRVGDQYTANKYYVKLLEGLAKLTGGRLDSARIVVAVEYDSLNPPEQQSLKLQTFVAALMPHLEQQLDKAVEGMDQ